MGGLFGGGSDSLVNSDTWSNLQDQMANYTYDPNDPDKWQRLLNQAGNYQGQTANVGSSGGAQSFGDWLMSKEGAQALQSTGDKLKGPESGAKPPDPKVTQAQLGGGSQVVPGSANSVMSLLQMLSQRRYSPIGYSGGSSGGSRGLLGY